MAGKKAKGKRSKTRDVFKRKRTKVTVNRLLADFKVGDLVRIKVDPSIHSGLPPRIYHGKTATVVEKRGRAYVVKLDVGKTEKKLIVSPAHLFAAA